MFNVLFPQNYNNKNYYYNSNNKSNIEDNKNKINLNWPGLVYKPLTLLKSLGGGDEHCAYKIFMLQYLKSSFLSKECILFSLLLFFPSKVFLVDLRDPLRFIFHFLSETLLKRVYYRTPRIKLWKSHWLRRNTMQIKIVAALFVCRLDSYPYRCGVIIDKDGIKTCNSENNNFDYINFMISITENF